uniref:SixA phosphatase family protein n=1 Tax=uncultured Draconibacterium sp. TaxID=1573823 RepID=UPI003217396D
MKRVVIVRHGKAVPYGYENDFTRDLRERGKNDAKLISEELNKRGVFPDIMISSPAKRALKTARIFADNLDFVSKKIRKEKVIYNGQTTSEFAEMIRQLPAETSTAFFFGHNPGFYYFVNNLLEEFHGDMPTTSTVVIDFEVETWPEVDTRSGKLAFQLVPRMFK